MVVGDVRPDLDPPERIAEADGHSDELANRVGQALHVRGAAREHDLADAERTGLSLVELQRGDELASEHRERAL